MRINPRPKLDPADNRPGKEPGQPVDESGGGQDQQDQAEADAGGGHDRHGDFGRKGDGDGADQFQRLDRYGQPEVEAAGQVEQGHHDEYRRGAQSVEHHERHGEGDQGSQIPQGAGEFHSIEFELFFSQLTPFRPQAD